MHFTGRFDANALGGVAMAWPGVSFSVRVTNATRVTATLLPQQHGQNNRVTAYVDGAQVATGIIAVSKYNMVVPVSSGDHIVTFVKKNEAGNGIILVSTVTTDGQFEKLNVMPDRLIEVIGDNATAGASVDGPAGQTTCTPPVNSVSDPNNQNAYRTFGVNLAQAFGAEYSIIAASIRGVSQNYDGSQGGTIPAMYPLANPYDHNSTWTPPKAADVVVINLGTNDVNFWLSNKNGIGPDTAGFTAAYLSLLKKVRQLNPNAYVIATVGPVLSNFQCIGSAATNKACTGAANELPLLSTTQKMVQAAISQAADSKMSYFNFTPDSTNVSCDFKPDVAGHKAMAAQLQPIITNLTGWQPGAPATAQPAAAAPGTGPKSLPGATTTLPDPLVNAGDPNISGITAQEFPQCHYCSPQLYNANATGCPDVVGVSQPCEGYCHVPDGFEEPHFDNAPTSGNHYPEPEAVLGEHTSPVPRGHLLHSMEHGAIIFAYNCPGGCDSDLAVMRSTLAALKTAPASNAWVIMVPDPLLTEHKFAIMSWSWLYTPDKLDQATLRCFIDQHKFYGRECLTGHTPADCPALLAKPMNSTTQ
jgi:lysophospholipase L1-like esterase